ncbi:Spo0E family sporulation regulatory protein-aspartic acid phosphatase [Clostridium pasteurianum]|uniref:Spo0E like sporulation regulatory protein n=1 Tax=Clostridium pasteurianum BC1 TaxID=86416 RepID=R4K1K6_CLOPA|nr:Spo0E family sporulation regulatory protein-aspartic acid phosphatase [Clostridium pasteurianum]AGK96448.1 Spo0E like sporulation regulatory protein [Clostridium pasteurianum BC1]
MENLEYRLKIKRRIEVLKEKLNKCIDNNLYNLNNEEILYISEELDIAIVQYIRAFKFKQ